MDRDPCWINKALLHEEMKLAPRYWGKRRYKSKTRPPDNVHNDRQKRDRMLQVMSRRVLNYAEKHLTIKERLMTSKLSKSKRDRGIKVKLTRPSKELTDKLAEDFEHALVIYPYYRYLLDSKRTSRNNIFNYNAFVVMRLKALGIYDQFEGQFSMLSNARLQKLDPVFKGICEELHWDWIPLAKV